MIEPFFGSVAAAIAGRGVMALYRLVKEQFADDPTATAVLEAAADSSADSPEVDRLRARLHDAADHDPEFATRLRETWESVQVDQQSGPGGVNNQTTGQFSGNVVQARDIHGDIRF
ncbi:hypothetical protein [Saccharomonospora iraqiensis]|uniref:hypothetical protein n=1 Tax=Saccharomonospora iraqiensis TaxID=52698 RepID=UPI00022E82A3|nr:hypothetical protein [Saccharomonospora iraqiensis]